MDSAASTRVGLARVAAGVAVAAAICSGCNTAKVIAPQLPLRAASASSFAVDVEFAEPLDRASAEDATHYEVYPSGSPTAPATVTQALLIDSLYGRTVRLFLSDPAQGFLPDSTDYTVQTSGVRSAYGKPTADRAVDFRTGLNYGAPVRELFAAHCNSCHGPARADGDYRTDQYATLFGGGADSSPNLVAGNPQCLLVVKTAPSRSMFRAGGLTFLDSEIIRNWVVSYGARP